MEPLKDFRRERETGCFRICILVRTSSFGGTDWKRKLEVRRPREMFQQFREEIMGIRVQREDRVKDEPQVLGGRGCIHKERLAVVLRELSDSPQGTGT